MTILPKSLYVMLGCLEMKLLALILTMLISHCFHVLNTTVLLLGIVLFICDISSFVRKIFNDDTFDTLLLGQA